MSNIFTPCNQLHSSGTFAFWQKLVLISIFSLTLVPHVFAADAVITEPSQFNSGGLVNAIPAKDTEAGNS